MRRRLFVGAVALSVALVGAPAAHADSVDDARPRGHHSWVDSKQMPAKWMEALTHGVTSAEKAQQCRDVWVDPDMSKPRPDIGRFCSVYEITMIDYVLAWFQLIPNMLAAGSSQAFSN